ncbi:hypothetical protein FCV25MIE_34863, partial [Fagus crenata]
VCKHFLGEIMKFPAAQGHQKHRFNEEVTVGAKKADGPEGSLVVKAQSVEFLGPEKVETQVPDKGGLFFHTKPMVLESFPKGSVSDFEGSGSDRSCEEAGMELGAEEGMGEGVCLP